MILENRTMSHYLNENGLKEFDIIHVFPASGKSYDFCLNRTCVHFVSDSLYDKVEAPVKKRLVANKAEKLHLKLILEKTQNYIGESFKRFHLKVIQGPAFMLNGNYVFEAIIEQGDEVEISYNKIKFSKQSLDAKSENPFQKFNKIFRSHLPILIQGETGVGKTSLAKKVHIESGRSGHFVHLNLSAISPQLIESELFGHIKGSFTGALNDKKGVFKQADHGTLFLDEIDSLPLDIQTKLLTFLDDYCIRPVGSLTQTKVDTRIVLATGRDPVKLVEQNKMRKDFFFRVASGQVIKLTPLRDNPQLIEDFCLEYEVKNNVLISQKLKSFYTTLPWPGNYRQLKSHLEQKRIYSRGRKFNFDEQDEWLIEQSSHLIDIHEEFISLKEMKSIYAKKVFYGCDQNYSKAADKLDISTKSLKSLVQNEVRL